MYVPCKGDAVFGKVSYDSLNTKRLVETLFRCNAGRHDIFRFHIVQYCING